MSPGHDHHVGRPGLCHHLGLQITSIHGFQIRYDRYPRESLPETSDGTKPLGQNQRRAGLKPIDPGGHRLLGRR